jgi:CubicO group peptidase (beta-lactamase class C family)
MESNEMPAKPLSEVMRVNLMGKIFPIFFSAFFVCCKVVDFNSQTSYKERLQSRSTLVHAIVDAIRQKVHKAGKNLTQLEVNPFIGSIIIAKARDFNVIEAFGDQVSGEAEITLDAVFPLASLTKIYSAVLLRKALELKGVDVREPVENYLNNIDLPKIQTVQK